MPDTLPNRNEELPEQRYYDPQEPDNWADILHDVLAELSVNALVSGTDPSNHTPHDGTLFIPTDGGAWYLGDGSVWNELLAPGDYLTAAENASISGSWNFTSGPSISGNDIWHAGNDGKGSGLDADTVDGNHADDLLDEAGGHPGVVVVNSYNGADPSGSSTSDSAFSSAVSDANAHDTVLFYNGTFLLENDHDISTPLTIKCAGADLKLTKTASSGNERAQIRFIGGGVQAQTGITSAKPEGSRVIPVSDTSIFSRGDYILLMNSEYSLGVDTESQFDRVEALIDTSGDGSTDSILLSGQTDFSFNSDTGTVHRVDLLDSPVFDNVETSGGGDQPMEFRWCIDPEYDRCDVRNFRQTPLLAHNCYRPRWEDCVATEPLAKGSGEGEIICLYRCTDSYIESPRISGCRRGIDMAWGCTNTTIIDPVIKGFYIAGISVHQSDIGGNISIYGGSLSADPGGLTGNGITGSPNSTQLTINGTDITTRRAGIHASGRTQITDVTVEPAQTVNSGAGISIRGGPVTVNDLIVDDPNGLLHQPVEIRSDSRAISGIDIDARINYPGENAVYLETAGNPIEDVDLSGTIRSDSTAPGQAVFFNSPDGAFDNIEYSMDILDHGEYGIRLDGGTKNGEFRIHDAIFDCDPGGVPILDYSTWGGAEQMWIRECTLLYDSDGHSDSVHLGSGTIDYGWIIDNYAPGAINTTAVTNSETRGNMG